MRRRVEWIVVVALAGFVGVYVGDWAVYKLRGSPHGTVTVSRMLTVPLKGNKTEFDYQGSSDVPCSFSLFPQGGQSPCWRLRRHPIQTTNL